MLKKFTVKRIRSAEPVMRDSILGELYSRLKFFGFLIVKKMKLIGFVIVNILRDGFITYISYRIADMLIVYRMLFS
jgi:hypothetical protein